MSELINELALGVLQGAVFTSLPAAVRALFPLTGNPLVPNFVLGHPKEQSVAPQWPMVSVSSSSLGDITVPNIKHLDLVFDIWASAQQALPSTCRNIIGTIAEYIRQGFFQTNWSGKKVQIQHCWEKEASDILYEPPEKLYHQQLRFGVEAFSTVWY